MSVRKAEIALVVLLVCLTQQQLAHSKCPVYKALVIPNWARVQLSGVEWFEVLNYPGPLEKCVVRKYYPFNETMHWIQRDKPFAVDNRANRVKTYDFVLESRQQFLKKDNVRSTHVMLFHVSPGSFFQQILDSDLATWALLHICSEGDKKSKFALTLREPLSVIPADIEMRVSNTLRQASINQDIKWTKSPCMVDRTITDIFPQPAATLYPPPDAVYPYDKDNPLETEKPQEDDGDLDTSIDAEEDSSVAPDNNEDADSSTGPEINMVQNSSMMQSSEMSKEITLPAETETATELIPFVITTTWLPYENDEESWYILKWLRGSVAFQLTFNGTNFLRNRKKLIVQAQSHE